MEPPTIVHMSILCNFQKSLRPHGLQPTTLLCPWNFPDKMLEWVAGAVSFSRGISLTHRLNLHLLHWQEMLSPEMLRA